MRQEEFLARFGGEWQELGTWLDLRGPARAHARKPVDQAPFDDTEFPERYRRACQHLALAKRRGYSPLVLEPLAQLVRRAHTVLYRAPNPRLARVLHFFAADYPRLVRRHWRFVLVSGALFFVPMIAMFLLVLWRPELALSVMDYAELAEMERMYDPADPRHALGREGGTNLQMFGYYVWNNISIGFRAFASGLLGCVPSVLVLVSNGVVFGTVFGHLQVVGHGDPLWRFVAGHSSPELGAIVIAGAAGFRVGWALIAPGRLSRPRALVEAGRDGGTLVLGVFVLLLFAAFVEAYWSSIGWIPGWIKYSVGIFGWVALAYWLLRGGRGQRDAP